MKIELCEDNGFLNDGKPTLVVLVIDGVHRIPYEATKTIQELYEDVAKMPLVLDPDKVTLPLDITPVSVQIPPENIIKTSDHTDFSKLSQEPNGKLILLTDEIEKEDIVKCVKVHPRLEGADVDLEVGGEYRVLSIKKERGQVMSYDLMNDNSKTQFRITCTPDEVELLRKRKIKTNPVKTDYKQEIMKCAVCHTENALELVGDKYVGECTKCKAKLIMPRPVNAEPTT